MTKEERIEDLEKFNILVETYLVAADALMERVHERMDLMDHIIASQVLSRMQFLTSAPTSLGTDFIIIGTAAALMEKLPGAIEKEMEKIRQEATHE